MWWPSSSDEEFSSRTNLSVSDFPRHVGADRENARLTELVGDYRASDGTDCNATGGAEEHAAAALLFLVRAINAVACLMAIIAVSGLVATISVTRLVAVVAMAVGNRVAAISRLRGAILRVAARGCAVAAVG